MAIRPLRGWPARMSQAARFVMPGAAWLPALAAFLVRGGVVVLLLPIVVIPSPVGIAAIFGVDAFTISGQPTAWLWTTAIVAAVLATVWVVGAGWIGALVDARLVGAFAATPLAAAGQSGAEHDAPPSFNLVFRLLTIRCLCLLPLGVAVTWAAAQVGGAAYAELEVPTNLAIPFPVRVVERALGAVLVAVVAWLVTESLAAIAVRRALLADETALGALRRSLVEAAVRPLSTAGTILVAYVPSVLAIGAAFLVAAEAFDFARVASRADPSLAITVPIASRIALKPLLLLGGAVAVGAAIVLALVVSAVFAAWRSATFTAEVADATGRSTRPTLPTGRDSGAPEEPERAEALGLSSEAPERSGD